MRGKRARQLRKLLHVDCTSEEWTDRDYVECGQGLVGIIDGVNGNHDIEERSFYRWAASPDKLLYQTVKKVYKTQQPSEIYKQLMMDLNS